MATPLSPAPSAALNFSTPTANLRHDPYDANTENRDNDADDGDSSPFLSHIKDELTSPTSRRPSPPKARPGSRIISGSELSPLKILQQQQQSQIQAQTQTQLQQSPPQSSTSEEPTPSPAKTSMAPPPLPQSPRKSAPIKRFPVKVSQPGAAAPATNESPRRSLEEREERRPSTDRTSTLDVVRENEGLKHAIDIFEDEVNAMHDDVDHDGDHTMSLGHDDTTVAGEDHSAAADDSMISTFSAFSGVPNLTMLAQMRSDSPTKFSVLGGDGFATPRASAAAQARTPRANGSWDAANSNNTNTTTNLMDFTEQMRYGAYGAQPTPSRRGAPMAAAHLTTPQRPPGSSNSNNNLATLLDFDIPPAPTPRSIPTITPRELESLKSGFLSEISSLKASLSGKEAEVLSLKTAVGDAEKRVGECLEQLREVEGVQGALRAERDSWERRGREMEAVLRKVKEEIVSSQREREELEFKLDEADKRREAAEMMAQEAESKMAGMRAGKASAEAAAAAAAAAGTEGGCKSPVSVPPSNKEVEMAVERVARELHALYKSKHETKVAALKKSYEARWEKRVRQLQTQVDELRRENEEVARRASPDSHNGGGGGADAAAVAARLAELEEARRAERARDAARIRELEATVEKVEAVLKTVQADNAELRVLLERERVEKGELVQLAEEMMEMQQSFVGGGGAPAPSLPEHELQEPQQEQQQQQHQQRPMQTPSTAKTPSRRQSGGPNNITTTASGMPTRTPSNGPHNTNNNFRMSTLGGGPGSNFRASGLRAPGGGMMGLSSSTSVSRISGLGGSGVGRAAAHERTKSAAVLGSGRPGSGSGMGQGQGRPGSGQGLRSSIEKMGMGVGGGYGGGYGYGGRRGE